MTRTFSFLMTAGLVAACGQAESPIGPSDVPAVNAAITHFKDRQLITEDAVAFNPCSGENVLLHIDQLFVIHEVSVEGKFFHGHLTFLDRGTLRRGPHQRRRLPSDRRGAGIPALEGRGRRRSSDREHDQPDRPGIGAELPGARDLPAQRVTCRSSEARVRQAPHGLPGVRGQTASGAGPLHLGKRRGLLLR